MPGFTIESRGELAVVRLDSGPANALDAAVLDDGVRIAEELAAQKPGAIVLTGGERFFSAGLDLEMLPGLDREGQREIVAGLNRIYAAWYGLPRPVVGAIGGHAVAGGFLLALCADYRVASARARFGLSEVRVGVVFPVVALELARAELSAAAARLLMLRGALVDATEVQRLGVVDELAEPAAVLDRALEIAAELASLPRSAYESVKRQLRGEVAERMARCVAEQSDPLLEGWFGSETAEAAAAILASQRD